MEERDEELAGRFERQRQHLRAVAYRMLGSLSEADDAVQETWLRLSRADTAEVDNLGAWLTTVVGRVSLNVLRTRKSRREEPITQHVPDLEVSPATGSDPEHQAMLADSVALALLVVLDTLSPAERLAFVLHDLFAVPYEEIAPVVERTPTATRQLASRARRRVRGAPAPEPDLARQRDVVDAFFAAAHDGDLDRLIAVLHPDVVERHDGGTLGAGPSFVRRGARRVAEQAMLFAGVAPYAQPALVNGAAGVVVAPEGRPFSVLAFTVVNGRIVELYVVTDPERLRDLDPAFLGR